MLISSLVFGVVAFLLATGATLVSPLCPPCLMLFLGLGAGFVACLLDKPGEDQRAVKSGLIAGLGGGIGGLLGQIAGAVANALIMGPEGAREFAERLGVPTGDVGAFQTNYWVGAAGGAVCIGALDFALMLGLGALGGLLWWQLVGKKSQPVDEQPGTGPKVSPNPEDV